MQNKVSVALKDKAQSFLGSKLYLTKEEFKEYKSLYFPPMTPEAIAEKEADQSSRDFLVTESTKNKHGFSISSDSTGFFITLNKENKNTEVPVGATIRIYGLLGNRIHGIEMLTPQRVLFFYRTASQSQRLQEIESRSYENEQKEQFTKSLPSINADFKKLDEPFKQRMIRLREKHPNNRYEWEAYEMFTVSQANAIFNSLKTVEKIEEFRQAVWETQKTMVPELSDGHSNNTFAFAVSMAKAVVNGTNI